MNQEDPKWPIDTPVPNGGNGKNRTVPTSSVASSSTTTVPTPIVRPSTSNQKVHVNPKFMDKMAVKVSNILFYSYSHCQS